MAGSAAEGRPLGRLSTLAAMTLFAVFVCSATNAGVSGKVQKQVVMFHQYPVRVDVDLEARTAIVSPPDNIPGIGKSRTFYDYNTRMIAYKDYRARQCHLERMSPDEKLPGTEEEEEAGEGEEQREEAGRAEEREAERRLHRQMGLLGPPTPRNRQRRAAAAGQSKGPVNMQRNRPKTMYVTETVLSKYKVLRLAGRRISHFCRGFPATLLVQRPPSPPPPQLQPPSRVPWLSENELPGDGDSSDNEEHRLLLEAALVKARLAELEMQTLDSSSGEEKPRTSKTMKGSRSKRQATGNGGNRGWYWPRKFRGQTQSQFVSFSGDGKNDGTVQAEARPDGTTTLVRGANGMGQSQSQSSVGDDCDGCFPGGYGGVGYPEGGGPWQQPGYGAPGAIGGRTPGTLGQPGAVGVNGIGRGPGTIGGRGYTTDATGYGRPGTPGYGVTAGTPGSQNGQVGPGSMVQRPGPGGVAGGPGYPGGEIPGRGVISGGPGQGSRGDGGVARPPAGRPGYPGSEVPGRGVISGRPGYGSRGDGGVVGPTGGAPGGAGYPGGVVPGRGVISGRPGYGSNGDGGVVGPPRGGVGGPGYSAPGRETDHGYGRPSATNGHRGRHGVGGPGYGGATVGGPGYGIPPGDLSRTPVYRPSVDSHGHPLMPSGAGARRPQNGMHSGVRPGYETTPHAGGPGYGHGIHGIGGAPRHTSDVTGTVPSSGHLTPGHRVHGGGPGGHITYPSTPVHHISDGHRVVPESDGGHGPGHYIQPGGHDSQHLPPGMIQRPHGGAGTHDFSSPGYDSTHHVGGAGRDGRHEGGLVSPSAAYPGSHIPSGHGGPIGPHGSGLYPTGHGVPEHGSHSTGAVGRGQRPSGGGGHVSVDGYGGYPSGSGRSQGSGVIPGEGAIGHHARGHGAGPGIIGTGPTEILTGPGGIGTGPGRIGPGPGGGVGPRGRGISPSGRGFGPSGGGVGPSGGVIAPGEMGGGPGGRGIIPSGGVGPGGMGVGPGVGGHRPGSGVGPGVGVDRPAVGGTGSGVGVGPSAGLGPPGRHYYPSGSGVYESESGDTRGHGYPGHRPGGPHAIDDGRHQSRIGGYDRYPTGTTGHDLHRGITGSGSDDIYNGRGTYPPGGQVPGRLVPETIASRGHGGPGFDGRYPDSSGVIGPGQGGVGVNGGHIPGGARRPGGVSQSGRPGERQTYPGGPGYVGGQRTPGYGVVSGTPGLGPTDGQTQYGRPGYYNGKDGTYSLTRPGAGGRMPGVAIGGESQAQSSVVQDDKEIKAGASSQGKLGDGKAQAQVSGSYSGTGSFSAQAQTSDGGRGAQSQVTGNKDGGSSSAQGNGGAGQSQAQVQMSSGNGATKAEAQSGGWQHGSNTQVQAGENGGMADAQSSGPGTTSSQAQVGFKPHRGNGNGQRTPFRGGGTASAQSGTYSGQSQSQVQGSYRYGVTFQGAAQAGSSARGSRGISGEGRNGTRFERDDHAALIPDSVKLPPLKRFGNNNGPENGQLSGESVRQNGKNDQPTQISTPPPPSSHHIHQNPDSSHTSMHGSTPKSKPGNNGNQMMNGHSSFSEDSHVILGSHSLGSPNIHHNGHHSFSSHRQYNSHTIHGSPIESASNNNGMGPVSETKKPLTLDGNIGQNNHENGELGSGPRQHERKYSGDGDGPKPIPIPHSSGHRGDVPEEGDSEKTKIFKTEAPRQSQSVFVSPMLNEDVHITQASDGGGIPAQAVFQPGDLVPGTAGFRIPEGFRGRVIGDSRSIAGDETLAIASPNNGNSQSQTVVVTPGTGKVNYTRIVRPPNGKPVVPAYEDYGDNQEDSEDDYDIPTQISGHRVQTHRSSDSYSRGDQPVYSWSKPNTRNGETKPPSLYKEEDDFEDDEDDDEEDDIEDDETEEEVQPSTPPPPIPNSYVSVTKSVSGQLNPINVPQGKYDRQFPNGNSGLSGSNAGKFAHTYYTKSSTCGYFTFSCNVVFGSNGRAKICKPRPPTNPDGSPCCC